MPIILPTKPAMASQTMTLVANSVDLKPSLGGPTQRITRPGSRWQCDVSLPPMAYADAMAWLACLNRASTQMVRLALPQPDLTGLGAGNVAVLGANQTGTSLSVTGGIPLYDYRAGQFISLYDASNDRAYLHQLTDKLRLSAAGAGVLSLYPMLRTPPVAASKLIQNPPIMDGFIVNPSVGWTVDATRTIGLSFSVIEAE
jgi:hypothetical protein